MKAFLTKKYVYKIFITATLALFAFGIYIPAKIFITNYRAAKNTASRPCMTIFIHGSFGPLLGFLSFTDVLSDKISGTLYRATTKKMRMDDFFFKGQPILDRGLKPITPTLNPIDIGNKYYAVYPITKSYDIINQACNPESTTELFYTFGWSGLISQHSRRYEAIRLYNALTEELTRLKEKGIFPRIRLIAHSHGGNLCLNLAAVQYVLKNHAFDQRHLVSSDPDEQESIEKMAALFSKLSTKENAAIGVDQKIYDYVPENPALEIDELIMLGTPIQAETETFCYAPIFKTVYNLYSDEDLVQKGDWVSSKQTISKARVEKQPPISLRKKGEPAKLIQAMIITHEAPAKKTGKPESSPSREEKSLMQQLLAGKNIFARKSGNPTHKELWFFTWESEASRFNLPIAPLPIVTCVPLITKVLQQSTYTDATITLKRTDNSFAISATSNKSLHTATTTLPLTIITDLQKKALLWKTAENSQLHEFEAVYKHLGT